MDKSVCVRDVDLEYNRSLSTSRLKTSTATLFPPTLQSQPTSPEAHDAEEPPLCKRVVHVHLKASEKQQRLDAAWFDTKNSGPRIGSANHPSIHSNSDGCGDRILGSVWELTNEDDTTKVELMPRLYQLPSLDSAAHFAKQRLKDYAQQWRDGFSMRCKWTIMEACCRVTCVNWVCCLVLGIWLEQKTSRRWGVVETVLANAISGVVFQLLGGQAILIVGPSSPSLIFLVTISMTAKRLGVDAVPWMGWIGVWGSLVLLLLAMSNATKLMSHMTFFSWRVICIFIRLTFLWGAIEQMVHMFTDTSIAPDSALLSLWLATTTFFVTLLLKNARKWNAFHHRIGDVIVDYGPLVILLVFTALPLLPKLNQTHVSQVSLPRFGYHTDGIMRLGCIRLKLLPFWAILLAVIPGIMLAGMLFLYHNAADSLLQDETGPIPLYKSTKKWDICIVALLVFLCSLFGLPFPCGMLYQSHVHVRALTMKLYEYSDMEDQQGLISKVRVQRVSGLGVSLLSAAFLLPPVKLLLEKIPLAILTGLFLQLTCQQYGNWDVTTFIARFLNKRNKKVRRRVSKSALCVFFIAQISCIFVILVVSKTPAAVMFPLFILITLWVRHFAMRSLFRHEDFAKLDTKLEKDYSDVSTSEPLSLASHDRCMHTQQAWPQIIIPQTLKSAITVPMTDANILQQRDPSCGDGSKADIVAENVDSPLPYAVSPSLLVASTRRLKERSRRRYKRKRQVSLDNAEAISFEQQDEDSVHVPPLVKAMMQEQNQPLCHEQDEEINLSKRVSPSLSPQFFRKSKPRAGQERPLEVHSNLLYEPKRAARKQVSESKKQGEEPPSCSNAATAQESEIQSANQRQDIVGFQGSPGIGRCIRSPPVYKNQSPTIIYKKKQLQLSISIPRRRAFPKEEIYPGAGEQVRKLSFKPYPRLRKSKTSRWPTTSRAPHLQQQRHSTSLSKEEIECAI